LAPKFIGLTTSKAIEVVYDEQDSFVVTDAMYVFSILAISPAALLAVLQSRAFLFLYRVANQGEFRVIPQVKGSKLEPLPVPFGNLGNPLLVQLAAKSGEMADLVTARKKSRTGHELRLLERQIAATDAAIDRLVYELYGLTEAEIKIVEEATREPAEDEEEEARP
jgi:hypothetical protein